MWLNLYGRQAVRHKLKKGLKMHLCQLIWAPLYNRKRYLLLTAPGEPDFDRGEPDLDLGEPDLDLGDPDLDLLRAFFTGDRESDVGDPDLDLPRALTGDREPDLDLLPDFDLADPAAEPDRLPDLDLADPAADREAGDPDLCRLKIMNKWIKIH